MKTIIYGAGGIGCVIGGHLSMAGYDVVLIGRPGRVKVINEKGLGLVTPSGIYNNRIPAVTVPEKIDFKPDDLVFFCMKSQDTAHAVDDLKKAVYDVPVFCFQNGVRNEEIVSGKFKDVYQVMVRVGADYLEDEKVLCRRDPPGWFIISRYPEGTDDNTEKAAEILRDAGFYVKTVEDAMPYKWGKLLVNTWNAVDALCSGDSRQIRELMKKVEKESVSIMEKAGIKWISQEETANNWPDITAPLKGQLNSVPHSSTWQSLARARGSVETDFLNGEFVRLAEKMGIKAPINEKLLELMKQAADNNYPPGKYTVEELRDLLGC